MGACARFSLDVAQPCTNGGTTGGGSGDQRTCRATLAQYTLCPAAPAKRGLSAPSGIAARQLSIALLLQKQVSASVAATLSGAYRRLCVATCADRAGSCSWHGMAFGDSRFQGFSTPLTLAKARVTAIHGQLTDAPINDRIVSHRSGKRVMISQPRSRVVILYTNTGSGHRSVANAISTALSRMTPGDRGMASQVRSDALGTSTAEYRLYNPVQDHPLVN